MIGAYKNPHRLRAGFLRREGIADKGASFGGLGPRKLDPGTIHRHPVHRWLVAGNIRAERALRANFNRRQQ